MAIAGFFVGVGEEVPLAIKLIGGVVACTKELGIGADEGVASSFGHGLSLAVDVGSRHFLVSADDCAIGAALTSTAVVEADEKIVVFAVLDDEWGFDCIVTCLDGVVTLDGVVLDVVNLCKGDLPAYAA